LFTALSTNTRLPASGAPFALLAQTGDHYECSRTGALACAKQPNAARGSLWIVVPLLEETSSAIRRVSTTVFRAAAPPKDCPRKIYAPMVALGFSKIPCFRWTCGSALDRAFQQATLGWPAAFWVSQMAICGIDLGPQRPAPPYSTPHA